MDPVTSAIVTKGASDISETAKEGGKSFLKAVLQPPGEALGGILADQLNERRHANLIKIAARASDRMKAAGVAAKQVPLTIIHPALEAASLEEDSDLQEIWSNMLANAADPRDPNLVIPSFPLVLKELSPRDVKFLDLLYLEAEDRVAHPRKMQKPVRSVDAVTFETVFMQTLYATQVLNMTLEPGKALQLDPENMQKRAVEQVRFARSFAFTMDLMQRHELLAEVLEVPPGRFTKEPPQFMLWYRFSYFGTCFVAACRAPKA